MKENTIGNRVKEFATYLSDNKYTIPIDISKIKKKKTLESRLVFLTEEEYEKVYDYFFSNDLNEFHLLPLGLYLFSCNTGARLSDVMKIDRRLKSRSHFYFVSQKTEKLQNIEMNKTAKAVLHKIDYFLNKKPTREHINRMLKQIDKVLEINKSLFFHSSRHTFATRFLRRNPNPQMLQQIMGHSTIKMALHYSHIVKADVDKAMYSLDL